MKIMTIVRLTTCDNSIDANFIKNNLENEGIECFLTNEISSTLVPVYNGMMNAGIQIMINEDDLEKASKLIEQPAIENPIVCPNCNSQNIKFGFGNRKGLKILGVILSLLVTIPFGTIKRNYYCIDCKTEF